MIVVDASAMIRALVGAEPPEALWEALQGEIHAPHLLDLEVASVLRGLERGGVITPARAVEARADYGALIIQRHVFAPLEERVWALRHRLTTYDASYVALAEGLEAPLLTCDRKLTAGGHDAEVILFDAAPNSPR